MPLAEPSVRALLDREIMLTCLAEAVREDPADATTEAFGRVLEACIGAARTQRRAVVQRAAARALRADTSCAPADHPQRRRHTALAGRLANARLLLELRRVDLEMSRCSAAELRSETRALRSQARQIRLHARRRQR